MKTFTKLLKIYTIRKERNEKVSNIQPYTTSQTNRDTIFIMNISSRLITPQPFQSVSLSVEWKRKKGIDKNLIIYIIKNFSLCIFRFESDWLTDRLKGKCLKPQLLRHSHHSSLCFRKSTFRLEIIRKFIPKHLTFGFQFCIFAVSSGRQDNPKLT